MMEKKLGRPLLPDERVAFKNRDRRDLRVENLVLTKAKTDLKKLKDRKASIEDKIREYQGMLADVEEQIAEYMNLNTNEGDS